MPSDSVIHSLAGAAGGIVAMTATYPLIFLSTRAAVEVKNEHKSTYQAVLDIVKREGIIGLYSGLNSSLLGIAVTNGSRGAILNSRRPGGGKGLSALESILAGLIAGMSSRREIEWTAKCFSDFRPPSNQCPHADLQISPPLTSAFAPGSATTIISNPIWVVQTTQAVRTMGQGVPSEGSDPQTRPAIKKLGFLATIEHILRKDGLAAFWRGLGPALVLVMNPVIQYTVFEQLKNWLVRRRLTKLRELGPAVQVTSAVLSDWDYFLLGALSKLIATSSTYPYMCVHSRFSRVP
ncbi:mitochondrial carrier domain-containing protein [Cristinia sonorae]|uniref:Mitochondrial carrier domain-containing protein n=1 Tax=Cristinia sonorae TaxID=1940300 RepID=A0A8K0XN31_9AGAR|nr:mitochondrial carrier domain-containing protein [Cristinia sonorae]